jgi:hypothetical protein
MIVVRASATNFSTQPEKVCRASVLFLGERHAVDDPRRPLGCLLDTGTARPPALLPIELDHGRTIALWLEFEAPLPSTYDVGQSLPATWACEFERAGSREVQFDIVRKV